MRGHHGGVFDSSSREDHGRALGGPAGDSESWWTPQRIALFGWLEENAPALAPLYRGALSLATRDGFPGRVHFIAHAIREIRNRLPGALGPKVKQRKAGYEDLTDKIRRRWVEEGFLEDGRLPSREESVPSASGPAPRDVSFEFLASVGRLIEAHTAARASREARERAGFGALSDLGPNARYVVNNWNDLYSDVEKFAHAADQPLPAEADGEWVENFFEFEEALMTVSRPSYENLAVLDRLLDETNRR